MKKLDSFLGIPFGSNQRLVNEKLLERNGTYNEINSDDITMTYEGIIFGGRQTEFIMFTFFDNQFCKASVYIKPYLESKVVEIFNQIKSEINSKYFITKKDYETYDFPYEKNDGHTETAISLGKAEFISFWNFGNGRDTDDYIVLKIDENLNIVISYEDGVLLDKLVKKTQQKNIEDY